MNMETLLAERDIHRALCRFARAMDERDWNALSSVLAEDATGDYGGGVKCQGRDAFIANFRHFLGNCGPTQHFLGNLAVDICGDTAESRCYVRDMHKGAGDKGHLFFSTMGEYQDRWIRTPEGWRIIHRRKVGEVVDAAIEALGIPN